MGLECARDASDLLSSRAARHSQRRQAVRRGSAPHVERALGRRLARSRRRIRHRAGKRDRARDPRRRIWRTARSSTARRAASKSIARAVEPYTLERAEAITGVPGALIRELAHAYSGRQRAQLCWTLGITEHHNAVDNVRALINLALLCGHVGRYGSGVNPLAGAEQRPGRRRHGRDSEQVPGRAGRRGRRRASASSRSAWNVTLPLEARLEPDRHVRGDRARRSRHALHHRRKPGAVRSRSGARDGAAARSEAPDRARHLLDEDRRARRRRLSRLGKLVRIGRHGDEQRTPRAALS